MMVVIHVRILARTFHNKSITACGKLIVTTLVSHGDLGVRDSYSSVSQSFTLLFHNDRNEEALFAIVTSTLMEVYSAPIFKIFQIGAEKIFELFGKGNDLHSPSLARIFHTGSLRGAANPDVDKEGDGLRRRLYVSYCPRSNSRLTQYPSGVRKPQQNQYEISGLGHFSMKYRA
jgi:hypothetical protein